MDDIDQKILTLIQNNSKCSLTSLAKKVGLSAPSVNDRIKKLESAGVIKKYAALLDAKKAGNDITAFIEVLLNKPADEEVFIKAMDDLDEVQECHHITGDFSFILKVKTSNTRSLKRIVLDQINSCEGVQQSRTILALATYKEDSRVGIHIDDES